jgi:transcriptional regulator with XRE-family HTH domain
MSEYNIPDVSNFIKYFIRNVEKLSENMFMKFSSCDIVLRIKEAVGKKQVKITPLLKSLGYSPAAVRDIETGKNENPSVLLIAKLAESLDVTVDWILNGEKEEGLLADDEAELLHYYRELDDSAKAVVLGAAKAGADAKKGAEQSIQTA